MNINKLIRQFQLLLVLVIMVALGANTINAADSKGPTLKITTKDGLQLKGKLLSVTDRTLVISDRKNSREIKAAIDDLKDITIVYKPRGKNRFLKGVLYGIGSMYGIMDISDSELLEDNKTVAFGFAAVAGSILGAASELVAKITTKSHRCDIAHMSAAEVDALLSLLDRSCREDILWEDSYKNWFLGRLRISYRLYKQRYKSMSLTGALTLADNSWPGSVQSQETMGIYSGDGNLFGRIRVDYALDNKVSLGFEYIPLREYFISTHGNIHLMQDQQEYYSYNSFSGSYTANAGLIGVNLDFPVADYLGFRIETGIGLSFARMTLRNYLHTQWQDPVIDSYKTVKPAFQVSLSADICPHDALSYGILATFLYTPASFRGIQSRINAEFTSAAANTTSGSQTVAFTREVIVSTPGTTFNLGGFSLGFFISLR